MEEWHFLFEYNEGLQLCAYSHQLYISFLFHTNQEKIVCARTL